jgi:hypothetical protein
VFRDVARNYHYYASEQVKFQKLNGIDTAALTRARLLATKSRQIYSMFSLQEQLREVDKTIKAIDALAH